LPCIPATNSPCQGRITRAFATTAVVFKLQGQLLSHRSPVSSCYFPPPCTEIKSVPQRAQVGRKVHCSSHNRAPEIRKLCLSHAHVPSVATVLLPYPARPSHARPHICTKFILCFYSTFPTCTSTPWYTVTTKSNLPKPRTVFLVVENSHSLLLWLRYNSRP